MSNCISFDEQNIFNHWDGLMVNQVEAAANRRVVLTNLNTSIFGNESIESLSEASDNDMNDGDLEGETEDQIEQVIPNSLVVNSIWDFFIHEDGTDVAICKNCRKQLKVTRKTTTGIRKHLKSLHNIDVKLLDKKGLYTNFDSLF